MVKVVVVGMVLVTEVVAVKVVKVVGNTVLVTDVVVMCIGVIGDGVNGARWHNTMCAPVARQGWHPLGRGCVCV